MNTIITWSVSQTKSDHSSKMVRIMKRYYWFFIWRWFHIYNVIWKLEIKLFCLDLWIVRTDYEFENNFMIDFPIGRAGSLSFSSPNSSPVSIYVSGDPTELTITQLQQTSKTQQADGSYKYEFQTHSWVAPNNGEKCILFDLKWVSYFTYDYGFIHFSTF